MITNHVSNLCCYCGIEAATTKDHLPPKSIFNKPRPSDLITVPSCFSCNNQASQDDEKFKTYLGMHIARQGGQAENLFQNGVLPTVRHNNKLFNQIIARIKKVNVLSESGIYLGDANTVLWDSEAHDAVIKRMVRGLYYYHYGQIIGNKAKIKAYWFYRFPIDDLSPYYMNSVGNGAFNYYFNKADDVEYSSIWLFEFYKGHIAGGYTEPVNL